MARRGLDTQVTLSVIDRLIDDDPKAPSEPALTRAQSVRLLKEAVKRDLEWLMNTRQTPEAVEDDYPQLSRSSHNYGLPDLSSFSLHNVGDHARLRRAIEASIAVHEPRLTATRIQMDSNPTVMRGLRFQIQGMLRMDPSPEPVTFDTFLELPSGEFAVRGD
jgi:type VI secretion system protein ImpF